MKELTIRFEKFTLIINVPQQIVIHMDWLGRCERYTMEQYFKVIEQVKGTRP